VGGETWKLGCFPRNSAFRICREATQRLPILQNTHKRLGNPSDLITPPPPMPRTRQVLWAASHRSSLFSQDFCARRKTGQARLSVQGASWAFLGASWAFALSVVRTLRQLDRSSPLLWGRWRHRPKRARNWGESSGVVLGLQLGCQGRARLGPWRRTMSGSQSPSPQRLRKMRDQPHMSSFGGRWWNSGEKECFLLKVAN